MKGHRLTIASLMLGATVLSACTQVDRSAERAFVAGRDGPALEELGRRRDRSKAAFALESSLLASAALAAGDYRSAADALDSAAVVMGIAPGVPPRRVASMVRRRATRLYRGEPFEKVMNCLYRALLALRDGAPDTALLALAQGMKADSEPAAPAEKSDVSALYLLDALIDARGDAPDGVEQSLGALRRLGVSPPSDALGLQSIDTVIWIDAGLVPAKTGGTGTPGTAEFAPRPGGCERVALEIDGKRRAPPILAVDLHAQATTPVGGLPIDGANPRRTEERREGRGIISVLHGTLLLFTAWIPRHEDLRQWHLLPARSYLWIGDLEPGTHTVALRCYDANGDELDDHRQTWHTLPLGGERLSVIYLRVGPRRGYLRIAGSSP